jgi:sterol desaturase/sphingolipid hydroxylase (fatty acid hydroxylase superfamily)
MLFSSRVCVCVCVQIRQPKINFWKDLYKHVSGLESFIMLVAYLSVTWMFRIMPASYYDLESRTNWLHVFFQFCVVDFCIYWNHILEHRVRWLYGISHKPHHAYITPKTLDAFSGSIVDTTILILIPLVITAQVVHCCCWSYIAFGTLYASYFVLIHSEFRHPWDDVFEFIGIGTAEDHNVHHAILSHNFGHFFMWWDQLFGTFKSPLEVRQMTRSKIVVNGVSKKKEKIVS